MPGSKFNGNYNGLSIGSGGVALTYAGFTVGGNVIGGKMNGQMGLQPSGGAPLFGYLLGAKYVNGPWTVGIVGEQVLGAGHGHAERHQHSVAARGIDVGAGYAVAPGYSVYAEYLWNDQTQSANNFVTGAVGTAAGANLNNNIKGQGFLIGNVVNF